MSELTRASDSLRNQRAPLEAKIREKEVQCKEEAQVKKEINGKLIEFQQKVAQLQRQKQKVARLKDEIIGKYFFLLCAILYLPS